MDKKRKDARNKADRARRAARETSEAEAICDRHAKLERERVKRADAQAMASPPSLSPSPPSSPSLASLSLSLSLPLNIIKGCN